MTNDERNPKSETRNSNSSGTRLSAPDVSHEQETNGKRPEGMSESEILLFGPHSSLGLRHSLALLLRRYRGRRFRRRRRYADILREFGLHDRKQIVGGPV